MTGPRGRRAAGAAAAVICLAGCGLPLSRQAPGTRAVTLPAARPSVLIVVADQGSAQAVKAAAALIAGTARAGERVLVIGDRGGVLLASSAAPPSPSIQVAAPPPPLPAHPTSYQEASHARALHAYRAMVRQDQSLLVQRQRAGLAAWAKSITAAVARADMQGAPGRPDVTAGLDAAAAALTSLRQGGTGPGTPAVVAIVSVSQTAARSAPVPASGLQAATVAVGGFPGNSSEEAAWQASLLQAGAAWVTVLTPATDGQFAAVVREGLDGAVTDTLTSVLFGLGRHTLSRAAMPQLEHLLTLLTVRYPHATAAIDGYTDDLPAPGGNLKLSLLRAQAVREWLIAHGVASGRLQAFGYGDTDPVAPNTPSGQPLNRRVVAVIDPVLN